MSLVYIISGLISRTSIEKIVLILYTYTGFRYSLHISANANKPVTLPAYLYIF